jgi:predicted peroxiredoxin
MSAIAANNKVVINLTTGPEDAERATVAFLVGRTALQQGKQVKMLVTKEAVRLAVSGVAETVSFDGYPPFSRVFQEFADGGGELFVCPLGFKTKELDEQELVPNARIAGATPLWEWIGEGATVFSY